MERVERVLTARERVWNEIMELVKKRLALIEFMKTPLYSGMSEIMRGLLYQQNLIMKSYEMVLRMRYNMWDGTGEV